MYAGQIAEPILSPEPILSTAAAFRGRIIDLDQSLVVDDRCFVAACRALSRRLRRNGLTPGDRVVLGVGNGPVFIAALVAILEAGGALVGACGDPAGRAATDRQSFRG